MTQPTRFSNKFIQAKAAQDQEKRAEARNQQILAEARREGRIDSKGRIICKFDMLVAGLAVKHAEFLSK